MATKAQRPTEERRIKDAMFSFHESIPSPVDPDADPVLVERVGYHGQTVSLLPHDIERGEKHGAFFTEEEPQQGEGAKYASQFTHDELVRWLVEVRPNTQQVTQIANEDPDPTQAATKLLAAEREATQNDPRGDLVIGLEAIISGAESEQRSADEESTGDGE